MTLKVLQMCYFEYIWTILLEISISLMVNNTVKWVFFYMLTRKGLHYEAIYVDFAMNFGNKRMAPLFLIFKLGKI